MYELTQEMLVFVFVGVLLSFIFLQRKEDENGMSKAFVEFICFFALAAIFLVLAHEKPEADFKLYCVAFISCSSVLFLNGIYLGLQKPTERAAAT